jgi:hypothetical protein
MRGREKRQPHHLKKGKRSKRDVKSAGRQAREPAPIAAVLFIVAV